MTLDSAMTPEEEEQAIVSILVGCPPSQNPFDEPAFAVRKTMGWMLEKTLDAIDDLEKRKLLVQRASPFKRLQQGEQPPMAKFWWECP